MSFGRTIKIGLCWIAVLAGLSIGIFFFALLGIVPLVGPYPVPWQAWLASIALFSLGCAEFTAPFVAFRNPRAASFLYFVGAPLASLAVWVSGFPLANIFSHSTDIRPTSASLLLAFIPLVLLGYFWSIVRRYHWSVIPTWTTIPVWVKRVLSVGATLFTCVCICAISVHLASSWEFPGDCGLPTSFAKAYSDRPVFIARVVHVDAFTGAMAIVEQRFGELPWWNKIVFLKFVSKKGSWFVDGRFEEGIVTRWLIPVLDLKCTGSNRIEDAGVELRLFRDSPHWDGVRIIGRVLQPSEKGLMPAVGVAVTIEGPDGPFPTVTDHDGIYDVSGLPSGHYSVHVPHSRLDRLCPDRSEQGLKPGEVWGCEFWM